MSMLPQEFPEPTAQCPVDVHGLIQPAREVGGDLYDFFTTETGATKSLIRIATELMCRRESDIGPAEIIGRVNRELCQNNNDLMFVTLFFGMLNPTTGEVAYCNAGHNPPYRTGSAQLTTIDDGKGIILGVRPQATYRTGTLTLAPGETLYLFSDGVTEAHDPAGALFSSDLRPRCVRQREHAVTTSRRK